MEVLNGKYCLSKEIGRGGFGVVYLATDKSTNTEVAIKKIDGRKATSECVRREIIALKNLKHRHIVRFIDEFVKDGDQYIVMQYCRQGSLRDYVLKNGPMDDEVAAFVMRSLVITVSYIHSNEMMHRDLSAQNILIEGFRNGKFPEIVVSDFGLSTNLRREGQHTIAGTPGYMDENILHRHHYTKNADVFALGGILYLMLSGREPPRRLNDRLDFEGVSQQGRNLIMQMREQNEKNRISLHAILSSPFMERFRSRRYSASPRRSSRDSSKAYSADLHSTTGLCRVRSGSVQPRLHSSQRGHDSAFESGSDFEIDRVIKKPLNYEDRHRPIVGRHEKYSDVKQFKTRGLAERHAMKGISCESFSNDIRSTGCTDVVWPLRNLEKIAPQVVVRSYGRFIFATDNMVTYEILSPKKLVQAVMVVEYIRKTEQQNVKLYQLEGSAQLPGPDDPPLNLKRNLYDAFSSIEELQSKPQKFYSSLLRLYKRIVATYEDILGNVVKEAFHPSMAFTARLTGNGDFYFDFNDGTKIKQLATDVELKVANIGNDEELSKEELNCIISVRKCMFELERLKQFKRRSSSHSHNSKVFSRPCSVTSGRSEKRLGIKKWPASEVDAVKDQFSENSKETLDKRLLLPRGSYTVGSAEKVKGPLSIQMNNARKKLRISTSRPNEFVYEENGRIRRFFFDVSERDYSQLSVPLACLMYTLLNEVDSYRSKAKGRPCSGTSSQNERRLGLKNWSASDLDVVKDHCIENSNVRETGRLISESNSTLDKRLLLPRGSYTVGSAEKVKGPLSIQMNNARKKLRISTSRPNEFVYEENGHIRRFSFDVSERDYSQLPMPLASLMFTLLNELDLYRSKMNG